MADAHSGELLRRSRSGDGDALNALLEQHLPGLRAFARVRMSPRLRAYESGSDLVQSACRELLLQGDDFEYRGEETFRAWLYTTVLHKILKRERHLVAQKRDVRRQVGLEGQGSEPGALANCYSQVLSPSRQLIAEERVRRMEAAFDELPEHYREVIALSRFARLSRPQVAAQMQRSEGSVRSLLTRALATLAEAMDEARADDEP